MDLVVGFACLVAVAVLEGANGMPEPQVQGDQLESPDIKSCGRSTSGQEGIAGKYPWMIHLSYYSDFHEEEIQCGGSLVSKRWVLTAAHCLRFLKKRINVYVKIGFVNIKQISPQTTVFSVSLDDIITYNEFDATTLKNDIALVKLPQDVILSTAIQPICLGTNQQIPFKGRGVVAGWNFLDSSESDTLKDAQVDILAEDSCYSPENFLCSYAAGNDTCKVSEAGSPLMVRQEGIWYMLGIRSSGPIDCSSNSKYLNIYSRLSNHRSFILGTVDDVLWPISPLDVASTLDLCQEENGYCIQEDSQCENRIKHYVISADDRCVCCLPAPRVCVGNAVSFMSQCLTFSAEDDKLSWDAAADACVLKGGRLATIDHPLDFHDYLIANYRNTSFWIGGSDVENEGTWLWTDRQPLDIPYLFLWDVHGRYLHNQDGGTVENCLVWNDRSSYDDSACGVDFRYICEYDINTFEDYVSIYNLEFEDEDEEQKRREIIMDNLKNVQDHNKQYYANNTSYRKGLNQYSRLTYDEVISKLTGLNVPGRRNRSIENYIPKEPGNEPSSLDWVDKGVLSPIRNQNECGSCWAFSATSVIESQINIKKKGGLHQLSEQYLVDCDLGNEGCNGGWPADAIDYVMANGIALAAGYTYTYQNGTCNNMAQKTTHSVKSSMKSIRSGNDAHLLNANTHIGPISVCIYVSPSFLQYKSGVFVDETCTSEKVVNHALVLVGYGTENGLKYWLLRNSWGTSWGENGYMKMSRSESNYCQISSHGIFPVSTEGSGNDVKATIGSQHLIFSQEQLTWTEALSSCKSNNGTLATAASPYVLLSYIDEHEFWVGGSDSTDEGMWVWDNGDAFDSNFPWSQPSDNPLNLTQPDNNGENEDCLVAGWFGGYDDRHCNDKKRFICEKSPCEDENDKCSGLADGGGCEFKPLSCKKTCRLCDCVFGEKTYPDSDFNDGTCMNMICNNGNWKLTGEHKSECGKCNVLGWTGLTPYNPHHLIDGSDPIDKYDLYDIGKFVLSQLGLDPATALFSVSADFVPCIRGKFKCVSRAFYSEPGIEVELTLSKEMFGGYCYGAPALDPLCSAKILVNRKKVIMEDNGPANSFSGTDGTVLIFKSCDNYRCTISIVGSKGLYVSLYVQVGEIYKLDIYALPSLQNQLNGLCDTFTGVLTESFTLQDGNNIAKVDDLNKFIDSWKVTVSVQQEPSIAIYSPCSCGCVNYLGTCVVNWAASPSDCDGGCIKCAHGPERCSTTSDDP